MVCIDLLHWHFDDFSVPWNVAPGFVDDVLSSTMMREAFAHQEERIQDGQERCRSKG